MEDLPEPPDAPESRGKGEVACGDGEESFSDVKRKRKREKMDTSDAPTEAAEAAASSTKRPAFPPVNISTSLVGVPCQASI